MSLSDQLDDILSEIGFGRWQWLVLVMALCAQTACPVQQLGSPLLSAPVPFRCSFPDQKQFDNATHYGIPNKDEIQYPSVCNPKKEFLDMSATQQSNNTVIAFNKRVTGLPSCPEIEYDTSMFQSTVVTEWNLVCEDSFLRPLFQMTFPIGGFIGSAICGQLSDRLGRKRTLQMGNLILIVSILATSVVPWYTVVIALRVLSGTATIIGVIPSYTLLLEVTPKRRRTITSIGSGVSFFVGMATFAGLGYLQPNWRKLILISNSQLLLMIPLTIIIDESPRWLIQSGRNAEAVNILRKAAKKNGVSLSSSTSKILHKLETVFKDDNATKESQEGVEKGDHLLSAGTKNLFALVRTYCTSPGMRIILILSPLMWFFQRSQFIGIAINANNFASSNPFKYVAFSAAMGCIAIILTIPSSYKLSRRLFLGGTLSISGILMLLEMAVPSEYWMIKWIMVMVAFCLSCGAFQVNILYANEVYPTLIRTRGFTFNCLIGAIGEAIIPLVTDIAVRYYWWAASVTFGLGGIIASIILPFLPETRNLALPETLQDVEDRYWKGRKGGGHLDQNLRSGIPGEPQTGPTQVSI